MPVGGTTGQVLSKTSETDYDTTWTTPNLDFLDDVAVSEPQWGQVLYYNGDTQSWVNDWVGPPDKVQWNGYNPSTTDPIPAVSAVYVTDISDGQAQLALASNANETGKKTAGVTFNEIAPESGAGFCLSGTMFGVPTSDWVAGDVLWLGVGGEIVNTRPTSVTSLVRIGVVLRADPFPDQEGAILVNIEVVEPGEPGPEGPPGSGASSLDELTDVAVTSPQWNQVLVYNGETNSFQNQRWQPDGVNIWCYNTSESETIPANSVVYAIGGMSEYGDVAVAVASNNDTTGQLAIGLTQAEMAPNGGYSSINLSGVMGGWDTSAYAPGDTLWLGIDGALTTTKPTSVTSLVRVGTVLTSSETDGNILVSLQVAL